MPRPIPSNSKRSRLGLDPLPGQGIDHLSVTSSAFQLYCGGLSEACWLTAVIIVPLIYNPQARDGFDPFKTAFFRLFSFVLLASLSVKVVDRFAVAPPWVGFRNDRFRFFGAALLSLYCLSILGSFVVSVYPWQSFWGSYQQGQGTLTELGYLVFFMAVSIELRSAVQFRRLITAILVPTIPISLHAIMQHLGWDPLPIALPVGGRVFGLAGNPVYLAAYLGIAFPFTILRIFEFAHTREGTASFKVMGLIFYMIVGSIQLAAFLFSESRGPLLGLVGAVSFLAIAHSAMTSRRRLIGVLGIAALAVVILVFFGASWRRFGAPVRFPGLSRLAGALPSAVPAGEERIESWNQATRFLKPTAAFRYPSGSYDIWHRLRPWIGFGAETLQCVLPQSFSPAEPTQRLISRFHNHFWDRWYSYGAIGTLSYLVFIVFVFGFALRRLGLIRFPSEWRRFFSCVGLSVVGLSFALAARFGLGFLGLGVMGGLPLGVTLYIVFWGLASTSAGAVRGPLSARRAVILSTLAILVMNLIETAFAFPVTITALLFWICLGVAVAASANSVDPPDVAATGVRNAACQRSYREILAGAMCAGMVAAVLAFAFVYAFTFEPVSVGRILLGALTKIRFMSASSHLIPVVLIPTWIGVAFAFWLEMEGGAGRSQPTGWLLLSAVISAAVGTLCAVAKAAQIGIFDFIPEGGPSAIALLVQGGRYEAIVVELMALCLGLAAVLGWCCCAPNQRDRSGSTRCEPIVGLAAFGAAGVVSWVVCVNPVRADAMAGWANALGKGNQVPAAILAYQDAVKGEAHSSAYRFELTDLLVTAAEASANRTVFDDDLGEAVAILEDGRKISKLDQSAFVLGNVLLRWAEGEEGPARRLELAKAARASFDEALAFEPNSEVTLVDYAAVDQMLLRDPGGAVNALKRADGLISARDASDWFDFYAKASAESRYPELKLFYDERAVWCCDQALAEAVRQHESTFSLYFRRSMMHYQLGNLRLALVECRRAVADTQSADAWEAEALLAAILGELGDRGPALAHMSRAIGQAPESHRAELEALRLHLAP